MELSSARWLSELAMDDPSLIQPYTISSHQDHFTSQPTEPALGDDFQHTYSSENYTFSCSSMDPCVIGSIGRPLVQLSQTNTQRSVTADNISAGAGTDASSPSLISFSNQYSESPCQKPSGDLPGGAVKPKDEIRFPDSQGVHRRLYKNPSLLESKKGNMGGRIPASQAQEHIIAERKRREKLTQRFIALSAVVPGLKKMDKVSVLGDAVKYVKELQERVKNLEDQTMKRAIESVVLVKKSFPFTNDAISSSDESSNDHSTGESLPEIELKVSEKTILVRIHCEKRKGVLVMVLAEIEKLHLTVISSSVLTFAGSTLDITVVAKMEEEFCMAGKDVVKNLRSAFSQFM